MNKHGYLIVLITITSCSTVDLTMFDQCDKYEKFPDRVYCLKKTINNELNSFKSDPDFDLIVDFASFMNALHEQLQSKSITEQQAKKYFQNYSEQYQEACKVREMMRANFRAELYQDMADSIIQQHNGRPLRGGNALLHGVLQGMTLGSRR